MRPARVRLERSAAFYGETLGLPLVLDQGG